MRGGFALPATELVKQPAKLLDIRKIPRAEYHPKRRRNSATVVKNWSIVSIHEGIACRIIDQGEKHVSPRGKTGESDELYRSEKPL